MQPVFELVLLVCAGLGWGKIGLGPQVFDRIGSAHLAAHAVVNLTAFPDDLAVLRSVFRLLAYSLICSGAIQSVDTFLHGGSHGSLVLAPFGRADLIRFGNGNSAGREGVIRQ